MSAVKIKKAVIREDLLSITNDFRKAIILNQFIYWSERVSDADKFIEKENEIAKSNGEDERELFYGWIYKTAEELAEEIMLGISASQIRKYINELVESGYISKRNNPKCKWDRTLQYRVNLVKIAKSLKKNGYPLSDYKIDIPEDDCNAHGCAIDEAQSGVQKCLDNRAIPEITNIDYSTDNTFSPTELNSFSKEKAPSPVGLNSSISKRNKKGGAETDKWIATKTHIEVCMERYDYEKDSLETIEVVEIVKAYYEKYKEMVGKPHPRLNDKVMMFVVGQCLKEVCGEVLDVQTYRDLIDFHFKTEYREGTDWTIQHFMSGDIRETLLRHNML